MSDPVVELRSGTEEPVRLCWSIARGTLAQLNSQKHVPAYLRRLDGQAVTPSLRGMLAALPNL